MAWIGRCGRRAAVLVIAGVVGCGGADDPKFAPTRGSAPADAAKTPQDVDAKIEQAKSKRDI